MINHNSMRKSHDRVTNTRIPRWYHLDIEQEHHNVYYYWIKNVNSKTKTSRTCDLSSLSKNPLYQGSTDRKFDRSESVRDFQILLILVRSGPRFWNFSGSWSELVLDFLNFPVLVRPVPKFLNFPAPARS